MAGPTVVVTGFDAFGGMATNPSVALVARLGLPGLQVVRGVIPTSYGRVAAILRGIFAERPAAVVMFGFTNQTDRLRIEHLAVNRDNFISLPCTWLASPGARCRACLSTFPSGGTARIAMRSALVRESYSRPYVLRSPDGGGPRPTVELVASAPSPLSGFFRRGVPWVVLATTQQECAGQWSRTRF
jgi:Pyroglutamyl peptidase